MRLLKTTLAVATAAASLATATTAMANTTVEFWTFRPQEEALWNRVNQENLIPGVTVNFNRISNDDYEARLRIALQRGGPDIFSGKVGAQWLAQFIAADAIVSMEELGVDLSNILPGALAGGQAADGQFYGVPFAVQLQSIIYNTDAFESLGLAHPTNIDEFEALLRAADAAGMEGLAVAGQAGWYLNQVFNEVIMAGLVADADQQAFVDGTKCFTDPVFVSALERVASWGPYMSANPTATNYDPMRTAVASGDALMMIDGAWSTGPASPMYEINPDFYPGFMAVPGVNGKVVAHPDGAYLANARSEKLDAVRQVLEFTTTETFGQLFLEEVTEPTAVQGEFVVENDITNAVMAALANAASIEPFIQPALNADTPNYGELIAQQMQRLLAGNATAAEAAAAVQAGLNSWGYVGAANCR